MLKRHHSFMWSFTKSFLFSLKRPVIAYLVTLSLTVQVVFALLIFYVESAANSKINSFFDALYFTVTLMTGVGLGDIHATTVLGKTLSMVMMLAGTGLYVCFTGVIAASILTVESEHKSDREK